MQSHLGVMAKQTDNKQADLVAGGFKVPLILRQSKPTNRQTDRQTGLVAPLKPLKFGGKAELKDI